MLQSPVSSEQSLVHRRLAWPHLSVHVYLLLIDRQRLPSQFHGKRHIVWWTMGICLSPRYSDTQSYAGGLHCSWPGISLFQSTAEISWWGKLERDKTYILNFSSLFFCQHDVQLNVSSELWPVLSTLSLEVPILVSMENLLTLGGTLRFPHCPSMNNKVHHVAWASHH